MQQVQVSPQGYFPPGFEPVTHPDTSADNRQLFFAKVSKTAGEDEIKLLFSEYGAVLDVIIFQSSQGSGTSKGCGLVTMSTHEEAAAALSGLHGKFAWSNRDPPMVVTWMDAALQDPARHSHVQPRAVMAVEGGPADSPPVGCEPDAVKLFVGNIPLTYTEDQLLPLFQQMGPVVELVVVRNKLNSLSKGCAFVWYATKADAEAAIATLNLKHMLPDVQGLQHRPLVVRKARTGHLVGGLIQKGSSSELGAGSSSGSTVASMGGVGSGSLRTGLTQRLFTQPGIPQQMLGRPANTYVVQQQATGQQQQKHLVGPISRWPPSGMQATTVPNIQHYGMRAPGQPLSNSSYLGGFQHGLQHHTLGQPIELMQGQPITVQTVHGGTTTYVPVQAGGGQGMHNLGGMTGNMQAVLGGGHHHGHQYQIIMDMGSGQPVHNIQHLGLASEQLEQYVPVQTVTALDSSGSQPGLSHGTMVALDSSQLSVVNDHLFSIQASSGAALMISPGGPGTFNLLVSGQSQQVERAQLMISSLLGADANAKP